MRSRTWIFTILALVATWMAQAAVNVTASRDWVLRQIKDATNDMAKTIGPANKIVDGTNIVEATRDVYEIDQATGATNLVGRLALTNDVADAVKDFAKTIRNDIVDATNELAKSIGPADRILDGTNIITAAGEVYHYYSEDSPWESSSPGIAYMEETSTYVVFQYGEHPARGLISDAYIYTATNISFQAGRWQYVVDEYDYEFADGPFAVSFTRHLAGEIDYVGKVALTNDISKVEISKIRDGTNMINAAGEVYRIGYTPWSYTVSPALPEGAAIDIGWGPDYLYPDSQWYAFVMYPSGGGPFPLEGSKSSTNLVLTAAFSGSSPEYTVIFTRHLAGEIDYVGKVALTNDIAGATLSTKVVRIGLDSQATSEDAIGKKRAVAIGLRASALGSSEDGNEQAVAVGADASGSGEASTAIGSQAVSSGSLATAIGYRSTASNLYSVALGAKSLSHSSRSIAIGGNAVAGDTNNATIGSNSGAIALGWNAQAANTGAIAIGGNIDGAGEEDASAAFASKQSAIALGASSRATGHRSIAIGAGARATTSKAIAIGPTSTWARAENSIAIGADAVIGHWANTNSVQIGQGTCNSTNTLQYRETPLITVDASGHGTILPEALPIDTMGDTSGWANNKVADAGVVSNKIHALATAEISATRITGTLDAARIPYDDNTIKVKSVSGINKLYANIPPVQTNRYAMFIIPIEDPANWPDIELKASIHNFDSNNYYDDSYCYIMSSGVGWWSGQAPDLEDNWDKARIYAAGNPKDDGGTDPRAWTWLENTTEISGYPPSADNWPSSLIIIVSSDCLVKHSGDPFWLHDKNEELIWSYVRCGASQTGREKYPTTDKEKWRPISPVKWFSKLPAWADQ